MNTQKRPLGAQISRALKARGVDVVFGIPGVHNIELYRGLEEAGMTHVLARHEQGAGFMADGYARVSGKPGVAYVITGPGLCNIMTAMGQAYSDSVPLLVISSCLERGDRSMARGRLHEMLDQEGAAACVTDWSVTAPDASGAYRMLERAFGEFASQRPRAKHIQVPIDVLAGLAEPAPAPIARPARPKAPPEVVEQVATALRKAQRPLFILGGGAKDAAQAARKLLDRLGAAVFPTYAGKGIIASEHALNFGACLGRPESIEVLGTADLILAVGTSLSEVDLWRDHLGHSCDMIRVDIDPLCLSDTHVAEFPVLGDAGAFFDDLLAALAEHHPAANWSQEEVSRARTTFRASTEAERPGIVPIVAAMAEVLPAETRFFSDMTQFAYVAKEVYPLSLPSRWHHPTGFGTLGYALPAAIGAKLAVGRAPVVAIAGDYGFHYTMQELGLAVELGLNLPIILWDNGKLKEIEDSMVNSQIAPKAVTALNPDFLALAHAFGACATHPRTLSDFQKDLLKSFDGNKPTLIYLTPEIIG